MNQLGRACAGVAVLGTQVLKPQHQTWAVIIGCDLLAMVVILSCVVGGAGVGVGVNVGVLVVGVLVVGVGVGVGVLVLVGGVGDGVGVVLNAPLAQLQSPRPLQSQLTPFGSGFRSALGYGAYQGLFRLKDMPRALVRLLRFYR